MNEEVQFYLDEAKERMEAALSHLESELSKIRAEEPTRKSYKTCWLTIMVVLPRYHK